MSGLVGYNSNPVRIIAGADAPNAKEWEFNNEGKLVLPPNGQLIQNFTIIKNTVIDMLNPLLPSTIWTSDSTFTSTAKLLIMLEQDPGDSSSNDVQSCEAMIVARGEEGLGNDIPNISIYGITYTSVSALATFSVRRNASSKKIEVVATLNNTNDPAFFRIHSIEMRTRD